MLIVTIGHEKYAVGEDALRAIQGMYKVEEKHIAGITKFCFTEGDQPDIQIQVVTMNKIVFPGNIEKMYEDTKALLKDAKETADQYDKWWIEERDKNKQLSAEIYELKARIAELSGGTDVEPATT